MKDLKIFTNNIEQTAKEQIELLLEQEAFKDCKVRIMPDVHAGSGCVIGFTGDLGDKVIPEIVGVDIGCGILCVNLHNIDLDLVKLDKVINEYIPAGMNVHEEGYNEMSFDELICYKELKNKDGWLERSCGTLGGGNHFIEIDKDDENNKYLVIHTGSRNLGKQVCEIYQEKAIKYCSYEKEMKAEKEQIIKEYKEQGREREIQEKLVEINEKYKDKTKLPKDLCYLEGEDREDYLHDMKICQEFAILNRVCIAMRIFEEYFDYHFVSDINEGIIKNICLEGCEPKYEFSFFESVHNYINFNDNIIRKGAISARLYEKVIIPMNMRDGCIIGVGKGNEDWNYSAPHGAGRTMSRNMAREKLNIEEFKNSMNGIYTTSVNNNTIDEAPMVYKPMQEIINNIKDTVEVKKIIKPIYNFKASD